MKVKNAYQRLFPAIFLVALVALVAGVAYAEKTHGRAHTDGVIYVISQGLYYDTFGTAEMLPNRGPFQYLDTTTNPPSTMYGPGDRGYVGGRWWVDANENGQRDDGDVFFDCPLLGPGRLTP